MRRFSLLLIPLVFAISCSKQGGSPAEGLNGVPYLVLDGKKLTQSSSQISGTGAIVIRDPLPGGSGTANNFLSGVLLRGQRDLVCRHEFDEWPFGWSRRAISTRGQYPRCSPCLRYRANGCHRKICWVRCPATA